MKKTFIKLCSVAMIGLALTACNNDAANKQAQDADNAAIDQLVQDKVKTLDDSLTKVCEDKVTLAAEEKVKAEPAAKPAAHGTTHHTTPAKPAAPAKKDEPKPAGGLKGKSDQAAPAGGGGLKSKSDQAAPSNGGGLRGKRDNK